MNRLRIIPITVTFLLAFAPAYAQKDEKQQTAQQHTQQAPQGKAQPQQPQKHEQQAAQQPQQHEQKAQQPRDQQRVQQPAAPAQQSQQHVQQSRPSPLSQPRQQHAQAASHQQGQAPQAQARPNVAARVQAPQPQRSQQQAQSWQQQRGWVKQGGGWQPHTSFQQGRDQNWASDHRNWAQRGGYGGYYIPQASFGIYFGSAHYFHIGAMPVMYMGYPRFAYGGYSFMLLDPWPGSWREDWYASDDVYIDYSDGYYLHDRRYPGVTLAVSVAL